MGRATHDMQARGWSWHRLKLHGTQVDAWFRSAGWLVQGGPATDRHAFIDELVTPAVVARRVWHTPLNLRSSIEWATLARRDTTAWLQVEGDLLITDLNEAKTGIASGAAYFYAVPPTTVAAARPTARIEVSVAAGIFDARELPQLLHRADSPTWTALASVINSIFNAPQEPDARTLSLCAHSIETLTEAMWFESSDLPLSLGGDTYARALGLISEYRSDPAFSVATLAEMLGVTRRHVTRVFQAHGVTPSRTIKRERVLDAQRILAANPSSPLETVAERSGFSSPRLLRESLRGQRKHPHRELRRPTP